MLNLLAENFLREFAFEFKKCPGASAERSATSS